MEWNGIWNGMEWNGIWNGMEWNMEWNHEGRDGINHTILHLIQILFLVLPRVHPALSLFSRPPVFL